MTKTRQLGKQSLVSQFTETPHPLRMAQGFGRLNRGRNSVENAYPPLGGGGVDANPMNYEAIYK